MGSNTYFSPTSAKLAGHFYTSPVFGVIRLLSNNQQDHFGDTGYFKFEVLSTGERKTAIVGQAEEIDPEPYRDTLAYALRQQHGVIVTDKVSALKMSLALLALDKQDAVVAQQEEVAAANDEIRLRRERYNAPLDQPLPPAV